MFVVTAAEMRAIDELAIEEFGVPAVVLMEHAGKALADAAWRFLDASTRRRVVVFAGKGNNGGDGCVAARHLHNRGAAVRIVTVDEPENYGGECGRQLDIARRFGVEVVPLSGQSERKVQVHASTADVVVDALLGTGSSGAPRGAVKAAIDIINGSGTKVVAADLPSGVDADTGAVQGAAVRADLTVTFGLPKVGLLFGPGRDLAGRWLVADIGMPRQLLDTVRRRYVSPEFVRGLLPERPARGHKGTFGRVLIVAGSRGLAGAAMLAAQGAQRVGAGLVQLAGPERLHDVFAAGVPEAIGLPLPEADGKLVASAAERVAAALKGAAALLVGPGLGRGDDVKSVVTRVVAAALETNVPVVVDADGLNALAEAEAVQRLAARGGRGGDAEPMMVLTPHPGEMARLCGAKTEEVAARPLDFAGEYARRWGAVVVLKGAPTVVADPRGDVFINSTGSAALASGGTGDVLAGAVAGLIAQGAAPVAAAVAGAFLHGAAGDFGFVEPGDTRAFRPHLAGLTAGEVARRLPHVMAELRGWLPDDATRPDGGRIN